jgi:hypothetical protein
MAPEQKNENAGFRFLGFQNSLPGKRINTGLGSLSFDTQWHQQPIP